jgi:RES domain-containing protein
VDLWRISNHLSLDGEGGRRAPARWHSSGSPIVYLAASPPGALIEILVHLQLTESSIPSTFTLLRIAVPAGVRIPTLRVPPGDSWKEDLALTRKIGDGWLASRRSTLARVPSSILPGTLNYLLNPLHPDAARIIIAEVHQATLDPRLVR